MSRVLSTTQLISLFNLSTKTVSICHFYIFSCFFDESRLVSHRTSITFTKKESLHLQHLLSSSQISNSLNTVHLFHRIQYLHQRIVHKHAYLSHLQQLLWQTGIHSQYSCLVQFIFYLEEHDLQQIQYQLHEKQQKYANLVMKKELRTSTLKPHPNPQQQHLRPDSWLAQVSDKRNMLSRQLASLFRLKLTPHPTIHGISVSFLHPIPRIFPFLSLSLLNYSFL